MQLLSLSFKWVWEDMTKTPIHCLFTAAFFLVISMWIVQILPNKWLSIIKKAIINSFLLIACGACEAYAYWESHFDFGWMFETPGNMLFGLIVGAVVVVMLICQYLCYTRTLKILSDKGGFKSRYKLGFQLIIPFVLIAIVTTIFFNTQGLGYTLIAFVFVELIVASLPIFSSIKNKGNHIYALLNIVVYIVSMAGMLGMFIHFFASAIVATILIINKLSSDHCVNCVSYDDGYCHYKEEEVGDVLACKKFVRKGSIFELK